MPITTTATLSAVAKAIEEKIDKRRAQLVRNLIYLGEKCVNEARDNRTNSYTDRTGNLRSSIGYVVLYNGVPVSEMSVQGDKPAGRSAGESSLSKAIAEAPSTGYVLVVVAGMHYAHYVAARGYNVIDSAEALARVEVPKMLDKLNLKWQRK